MKVYMNNEFDLSSLELPTSDLLHNSFSSSDVDNCEIIGSPDLDTGFWQEQTTAFTCAVEAQRGIIEAFGEPISEATLVYEATANGWLTDNGMSMADIGALLQSHGIDCHQSIDATVSDLMTELAQGHKVIVGVDSGELWETDAFWSDFFVQAADHAIWVTGVKHYENGETTVVINDSGEPNGAGKEYPISQFTDAWQDSGFFYVATDDAPMNLAAQYSGFDEQQGAFPELVSEVQTTFSDFLNNPMVAEFAEGFVQGTVEAGIEIAKVEAYEVFGTSGVMAVESFVSSLTDEQRNDLLQDV